VLDLCDQILVLLNLEMPTIKNVKLLLEVADALGYPSDKLALVLNRSDAVSGIKPGDLESILRQSISASIVADLKLVPYAANQGVPFVISNRDSLVSRGVFGLAHLVTARFESEEIVATENLRGRNGKSGMARLFGGFPIRRREAVSELRT